MSVCLVGSWAKVPNGDDALEMAENIFLNRDNAISLPKDRAYLSDFREKHPEVKAAFVDGIDQFDDQFFSTGESEAICMDPQQRMLMQGVVKALENAGITIEMASEAKCSVYTAAWAYDYKDLLPPDQYMATGNSASVMCGRITYFLNSRGAAVGIETACSSSLVAFHLARQAILNGDTNLALVCGANHIGSRSFHSLYNSHMVSPNGRLAAFDRSANGFVRAESFAVAVLCSQKFAIDNGLNVLCECTGSAFNSDGKTPSLTAPNPIAQHEVQLEAMKNMNINDIQLVTCHGTGTKLGDQIELVAIKKSFKPDIRIMSPKSSLCHGEGAAGLIGVLQSLYSMQHSLIPNQLHLQIPSEELNEQTSMVFVNEESELNKVAISSYGFGGTNACAILEKPKKLNIEVEKYSESKVLFLSAKSMESLKLKIQEYYFFMNQTDSILEDILFTENERKTKFDIRAAVFGKSREEMVANLKNNQYYVSSSTLSEFEIEFGEGNEKLWLLRLLYETNKTFQKIVDKYCGLAEACGFPEARTALFFPFKLTLTPLTYNISRLISSMATYKLLETYETLPTKLKGNGIGIIFALAAGNVIKFEEAVLLIKAMIAETDMRESLESISLKTSKVPIQITNQLSKKLTIDNIISELKLISSPSLMTFRVNGEEIVELDPIVKVQKTLCKLFVSGYEPKVTFRGSIVKTPGYSFLKRKFWPEMISIDEACATKNEKTEETVDSNNLYETVKEIVKKFLDLDEDDVNLLETGAVDSLTSIEMVEAIGSAVNHTMPFDLLETYPTTQLIVEYLKSLVQNNPKKTTLKESESKKPTEFDENVAVNVISADFMFAGVDGEKELWDKLLTSKLLTQKMTETRKKQCEGDVGLDVGLVQQDISLFDNSFFSIAKDEAEFIDPQHRLLLHSAYNALEKSGFTSLPDSDLYLAINSHSEYRSIAEKHIEELDERLWMGTVHSMAAGRLAALLGVRGKAVLVDTTCSSIASALEMGIQSIRNGKKFAVIATTHLIQSSKWLYSLRSLLAPESTKSFDMNGSGFCRSDGVGVIILKPKEDGDTPLLSINNASAVHSGAVVTPVVGTISQLLENCGDISYIEGHGTATMAGDSSESMAYQKLGKEVIMSSVKAQFGHCEVASGLIQLMKVACLSKNGMIPSIVHNALPNEHIRHNDKIRLPFVGEEYNIDRSAIVSFGITGTKTVVTTKKVTNIIEESYPTCCFLPISAKTKDGLRKMAQSFIEMLETSNESLYDISKMMQKQKINFKWRSVVVASDHSKAIKQFKKFLTSEEKNSTQNWHVYTAVHSIGCSTFFKNIDGFEKHYISFCNRLRFEPFSDEKSIYHVMSVVFSLVKTIIEQEITNSFVVSGFNSLIVLAAIDAAPTHYFNDLIHAFANNDARMMKRIARDVTIQVENIDLFNLNGEIIKTARQAVDAAIETTPPSPAKLYPENCLILSPNNSFEDTEPLQTVMDYYRFIGEKYIKGMAISFTEIFGKPKKIVDLPEYPFNRKSFWLPIKETQPTIVSNLAISSSKISAKTEYEFLLNSDEWKHVRNHVVDSQIVLPGATSIRLVFELYSHPTICLQNIDFLNKIIPKETPMKINQRKDEEIWILSCEDQDAISFKISELDDKLIEILPYQIVHAETKNADEIYHRFSLSQLTYRNEFQMLDNIKFNIGKGEAHFVPIHNIDVLIDGTLQAIVLCYFFENSEDHTPFVPFTIDTISIFNANIKQKQLHASLKYESSNVFIIGSATVYDEFENIILHIEKVSFKRLNGKTSQPSSGVSKAVINMKTRKSAVSQQAKKEAQKILHLWFEDNFGWSDIDDSTGFFDLGLTSIQAVKLRNVIKSNYPDASTTCIFDYPSVDELSTYLSSLDVPIGAETSEKMTNSESEVDDINNETEDEPIEQTRLSLYPVGVMSAACRLPGGISCPSEFWELLKIGKNASSRIPAHRISTRNNLIAGTKYGNSVEGGNFITQDVTQFDPAFFKISKSEAELIDPQQRILLECVQECLENSGVTETNDVGVFVGLMEKEYQDMMESSSILSMLGSMAAVIAGRVNYVFGCHGPSVTIDTACSSSLVALEMGVNALLDKRCSKALVAGVNLILNERGQGLRANGKMLSQHGMSLSFDSRASGYGRSDGCVVLMLELAKPTFHYMSTIQSVNVNHGGRSVSLTAPNGMAHKMLLTSVINQSPSLMIDYWEAHGTGTPLGDPIEFNTLSSILQNIIVGSVKASLGHGEASAGTCGLLKLFLMLTNQYVPTLIHFHVLNKDINAGSLRLPIIGEEADLSSAGISSFGVSGTNAAAIAFNDNNKLEPYTLIHKYYILPISAKNQNSLDKLENEILQMIPLTDIPINHISSGLSNNRSHFAIRNALIVSNSGNIIRKLNGKPQRVAKREKYLIKLSEQILAATLLQFDTINEWFTMASLKTSSSTFALKYALTKFVLSISQYIQIVATDSTDLIAILLANGTLNWNTFDMKLIDLPVGSLLNELAEQNLNGLNDANIKNYQIQPESIILENHIDLLNMIMVLYTKGYDIDWSTIYSPIQKHINLPNYQFNRQTLWFEDKKNVFEHYLIGTIDEQTEKCLVLKNMISELRHPQLFNGKPIDVGTIIEIAVQAMKVTNSVPFSIQNLKTTQISLNKPVWLKTLIEQEHTEEDNNENNGGYSVKAFVDDKLLFSLTASVFESESVELPVVEVTIPDCTIHLPDCPNTIIRKNRNMVYVNSEAEVSPFRTSNLVLNEIIGFTPNPSDMFIEVFGNFPAEYFVVQVDDGALWQFQIISKEKHVLSNVYVLKDATGIEMPIVRMHKKSTLLSSQEAYNIAQKTLQLDIISKVKSAFNDVIDSGLEIDESQMSTGFSELGMDSLATVDLLNRLNQKYFPDIELTTSDLFDNPNIIDLAIRIEELLKENNIEQLESTPPTPKLSMRERKLSIPAKRHQELAQIEFVDRYNQKEMEMKKDEENKSKKNSIEKPSVIDRDDIRRKISSAVLDLATESINAEDINTKGFSELGMDSLSIVDFVNRLNEKYFPDEEINTSDVFDYPTVNELTDLITRKKSLSAGVNPVSINERDGIVKEQKSVEKNISIEDDETNTDDILLSQSYILVPNDIVNFDSDYTMQTNQSSELILIDSKSTSQKPIVVLTDISQNEQIFLSIFKSSKKILINFESFHKTVNYLYLSLLNFVKTLSKLKLSCEIFVPSTSTLANYISKAFFKTVSSEKYPSIKYIWDQNIQQLSFKENRHFNVKGSWLITGGLSGIGFEIGRYLSNNGAENVILVSRREPTVEVQRDIATWKAKVHTIASDVCDKNKLIQHLEKINVNVTSIIHSAGVLKDGKIERQTNLFFEQVFKPKAEGFLVLEEIENYFNYKIENFIVMSSFTAACGNEGQLNYGVANAFLEYQILQRQKAGKSGCAIQWGNWIDTGMATNAHVRNFLADLGFLGQHNEDALKYLKLCIEKKPVIIMVANIDWKRILKNRKDLPRELVNQGVLPFDSLRKEDSLKRIESENVNEEDEEDILDSLKQKISDMTKLPISKLKNKTNIMDIGLDSRLIAVLIADINTIFKISLNLSDAFNYSTIEKLASAIWEKLENQKVLNTNQEAKDDSNVNKITVKNNDFCPLLGMNIFFDDMEDFEKVKLQAEKNILSGLVNPKTSGKFSLPVIGKSMDEIVGKIQNGATQQVKECKKVSKSVMLLTGQGSQYPMMGRQLIEHYDIFRTTLEYCLDKCDSYLNGDIKLWNILFDTENYSQLQFTKHMQPIMFSFGYAAAQLWKALNVIPDFYLGHSVGELVAGVLAGIMSIDDGLKLIVERGKAMENIAGLGALLAVQREIADDVLRKFQVSVATVNSPKQVVFAGVKDELDKALAYVKGKGKQGTFVNQKYPFHSNLIQESHLIDLRKCLKTIAFSTATTPIVSNITGNIIDTFSEEYIVKHTVSAVNFVSCIETLINENVNVWIDAGPASVLATFIKRIIPPANISKHQIVQTCKEKESDIETLLQSCLELEQSGISINWRRMYGLQEDKQIKIVDFPSSQKFNISDEEMEVLKDHCVNNKIIIAGAYQLYKLDQFISQKTDENEEKLILKNVKFLKPWWYEKDGKEFEIKWNADMTIELIVQGDPVCFAKISVDDKYLPREQISEKEKTFDVHEFYENLFANGLQYYEGFRRIDEAKRSDKKCFAKLLPSKFPWTLIDSTMHSITASVVVKRPDFYFLPVAMSSVSISDCFKQTSTNFTSQAIITSETDKFIQVNLVLFSGEKVILEIRNMTIVVMKLDDNKKKDVEKNEINNEVNENGKETESNIKIVSFDVTFPTNQMSTISDGWQFLKTNMLKAETDFQFRKSSASKPTESLLDIKSRFWDPEYFGVRPSEANFVDPQQRLIMKSVARMLRAANIEHLTKSTGVFVGCSTNEFAHVVYAHACKNPRAEWASGTATSAIAGRIAHWLKISGPTLTIDTACSSSFSALISACDALNNGKCEYAIVASINLFMHKMTTNVLQNAQMIVKDYCKVFDVDANGYKRSEAISLVLLSNKSTEKALAHIIGSSIGHNGGSSSIYSPNGKSQLEVMKHCIGNNSSIDHVEMHCTGTKLGDPIELSALKCLFPNNQEITISSIKSNIGHCEGSSGLMSLCSILLQNQNQYYLPQLHLKCFNNNSRIGNQYCRLVGEEILSKNQKTLINNFGFTGSNCSVLVEINCKSEYDENVDSEIYYPMLISSHTKNSLDKYIDDFEDFVINSHYSLSSISLALLSKKVLKYRAAIIYNFKRKIVWTNETKTFNFEDTRIDKIISECYQYLADGSVKRNKSTRNGKIELPPLVFQENYYWAIPPFEDEQDPKEKSIETPGLLPTLKKIFFEIKLVPKPIGNVIKKPFQIATLSCFGNFRRIQFQEIQNNSFDIILYKPTSNKQDAFLELCQLWKTLDSSKVKCFIICCEENKTMHTEWTGTIRSLASEKQLFYKFISFESHDQIDENINTEDVFEAIFYKNGKRFVQRLISSNTVATNVKKYQNMLLSGGTGGIGKTILNYISPEKSTIISRSKKSEIDESSNLLIGNLTSINTEKKFDAIFHLAGFVDNLVHSKMETKNIEQLIDVKLNGAKNIIKFKKNEQNSDFIFSSSIACVLGSFGQANYTFANGLVTSFLEKSSNNFDCIYWGPWKEVGMLARAECEDINKQIELNGWKPLSNSDALSVFNVDKKEKKKRQIIVFEGDFDKISKRNPHLFPFLSKIVQTSNSLISISNDTTNSFEKIFQEITGLEVNENVTDTPFMDVGIDSLCMENLRHTIRSDLGVDLTVSELFENATFHKLKNLVDSRYVAVLERKNEIVEKVSENNYDDKVAIIGWSAEFSGAENIAEFWENLMNGKCSTKKEDSFGRLKTPNGFDNKFFKITDEDAKVLDPQVKKFIQHSYLAMENSGYLKQRKKLKCAVFAGAEPSKYGIEQKHEDSMKSMFSINMNNYLASYAAYCLDLAGEASSVYAACSTTLVAICHAIQCLNNQQADLVLVGATSIADEFDGNADSKSTIFSKYDYCQPFDKNSDGIVRGSGAGCLVLKKLSSALRDGDNIHLIINTFAINNDGNSRASFMAPNPAGQLKCMIDATSKLNEDQKKRIEFVECHATGTCLGDTIELDSLRSAYASFKSNLMIGSCKANIGHSYASSGLAAIIKCALMLKNGLIPPQINFDSFRSDHNRFFNVLIEPGEISKNALIGIDSFGIGGTNVHMIVEAVNNSQRFSHKIKSQLVYIPISSKTQTGLKQTVAATKKFIFKHGMFPNLIDLQSSFRLKKEEFLHRSILMVQKRNEILDVQENKLFNCSMKPKKICMFFSPQGLQYSNILPFDYEGHPYFKKQIQHLCQLASKSFENVNFEKLLYSYENKNDDDDNINNPIYTQVALFIQCFSIFLTLKEYNINADIFAGHSVGEYVAAAASDVLSVADMINFLVERSKLVASTGDAMMVMVWKNENIQFEVPSNIELCSIVNDTIQCFVGKPNDVKQLKMKMEKQKIRYREINTNHGFHSSMMNPILKSFQSFCETITFNRGKIPWISSITGKEMTKMDSDYCANHLRNPVNLKLLADRLVSSDIDIVIEIGPSGVLTNLLAERNSKIIVIPTCGSRKKPIKSLQFCLGTLWSNGVDVKLENEYQVLHDLPPYQFDEINLKNIEKENGEMCCNNKRNFEVYEESWSIAEKSIDSLLSKQIYRIIEEDTLNLNWDANIAIYYTINNNDYHLNYHNLEQIFSQLPSIIECFIIVSNHQLPSHNIVLGLIRCFQLKTKIRIVYVENYENESLHDIVRLVATHPTNHIKISNKICFQLGYRLKILKNESKAFNKSDKVMIFGGSGSIGKLFSIIFQNEGLEVIKVSRNNSKLTCDARSLQQLIDFFTKLNISKFKFVINCIGKETSSKLEKTFEEKEETLSSKSTINLNILEAICKASVSVEKFINCSSLSSIIPIFGNEDYSAANCFVEALNHQTFKNIGQILTIGFPPIRNSRMFVESSDSLKQMLNDYLISSDELENILRRCVDENGLLFISPTNPESIIEKSINYQRGIFSNSFKAEENNNENDVKKLISTIWSEAIGFNQPINDNSNFFSLGGDSLNALQVTWQLEQKLGKLIHVNDIFKYPTLQEFSNFVENSFSDASSLKEFSFIDYSNIPLTNSQTQMFVLRQIDLTNKYNVIFEIRISNNFENQQFNWVAFKYSILSLIAYQNSYRTCFENLISPIQKICSLTESFFNLELGNFNLSNVLKNQEMFWFDIQKAIPLNISIVGDLKGFHVVFNQHHILTDGWSMTILAKMIEAFYDCYNLKKKLPNKLQQSMSKLSIIERQNATKTEKLIDNYLNYVQNDVHTNIPFDSSNIEDHKKYIKIIPKQLWNKLGELSKNKKKTPYNIALTIFCMCIQSFTNSNEILIAYADSGRNSNNSEIIGYCMNNILFRTNLNPSASLTENVEVISKSLEESKQFSSVPFFKVVERQRELNSISIYFNFRQKLDFPKVDLSGAKCEINHVSLNNAFDFSFTIDETSDDAQISIDYNCGKYAEKTITKFVNLFLTILKLGHRTNSKRRNQQRYDFPIQLMSSNWFKSIEKKEISIDEALRPVSYQELHERINDQSRIIEKSFQIIRASVIREDDSISFSDFSNYESILGCLYIGACYVPIDSKWPEQRKKYIQSLVSVSDNSILSKGEPEIKIKMRIFRKRTKYGSFYTIFTSGSTGAPKGVVMGEESLSSFLMSTTKLCNFRAGLTILNSVKNVFDVSLSNIFGAFLNNAKLKIIKQNDSMMQYLESVQYSFIPSAVFNSLTTSQLKHFKMVELVTIGGETISDNVLFQLLEETDCSKVIQIYGPTETCVWSVVNKCKKGEINLGSIIGKSNENETCYIEHNFERGQLMIRGISLGRGYLSTNSNGKPFLNCYATGDIIEKKESKLKYVGRIDNQVKWKGIRIDLTLIETEIKSLAGLNQLKMLVIKHQLVAFCADNDFASINKIKSRLFGKTTIPDLIIFIEKMPLNSSGKIDKAQLLQAFEKEVENSKKNDSVIMMNSVEEKVIEQVSQAVGQAAKLDELFTNIGGNSLSAIQVAHALSENIGVDVEPHTILQNSLKEVASQISKKIPFPEKMTPNVITKLREVPNSKFSIYLIHAIGGTIYPYYAFLQIFPKNISLYGIEFDLSYPSSNLRQLVQFYAKEIAAHAGKKQIFVIGHSMGGIMSREIVEELKIWNYQIPFVMMFDSWVLRTGELNIENIKSFITYVFSGLPDSEQRIDRAIKLAELLRDYKTSVSPTKLYLFKAKKLGDAAFKQAVRSDLNEELSRSMTFNGFDELSLEPIESFLIDGDHESCLKIENLRKVKELILAPFKPYF